MASLIDAMLLSAVCPSWCVSSGLYPTDPKEALCCDQVLDTIGDIFTACSPFYKETDIEKKVGEGRDRAGQGRAGGVQGLHGHAVPFPLQRQGLSQDIAW